MASAKPQAGACLEHIQEEIRETFARLHADRERAAKLLMEFEECANTLSSIASAYEAVRERYAALPPEAKAGPHPQVRDLLQQLLGACAVIKRP